MAIDSCKLRYSDHTVKYKIGQLSLFIHMKIYFGIHLSFMCLFNAVQSILWIIEPSYPPKHNYSELF